MLSGIILYQTPSADTVCINQLRLIVALSRHGQMDRREREGVGRNQTI
jgi:hypothetical protein